MRVKPFSCRQLIRSLTLSLFRGKSEENPTGKRHANLFDGTNDLFGREERRRVLTLTIVPST